MIDARWLRELGEERLTALLARRPEATVRVPTSLDALADSLNQPWDVLAALRRLELPALQVAEAIAALGGAAGRAEIEDLLVATTCAESDAVGRALASLAEHGLAHDDGTEWIVVPAAAAAWQNPLGLGPPVRVLVQRHTLDQLRHFCDRLGLTPPHRRELALAALRCALRDPARVGAVLANAPEPAVRMLRRLAEEGGAVSEYDFFSARTNSRTSPVRWAASRALILPVGSYPGTYVMPAEVSLALTGADAFAPFDPDPPPLPRTPVAGASVARDAAAAASAFLRLCTAVLAEADRSRVATLRDGGVGVRELKRLAKAHGANPDQLRLALALAHATKLVAIADGALVPTGRYDRWLTREPTDRLAELVRAWWALPYSPLGQPDPIWVPADEDGTEELRAFIIAEAALTPGEAIVDVDAFAASVMWHRPLLLLRSQEPEVITGTWREAALLGLVGAGALSDAGHALLTEDLGPAERGALEVALAGVGSVVASAHLQADLSAVVPGTPSPQVSDLLDATADRETTAAACTWRFSQASIRRALDAGHTADALVKDLTAIAVGALPQTLEYLIHDVARRHGAIRASAATCVLRGEDTALLAELVADRKLRALGLRLLAPTVAASAKPLPETLAALRAAGYAPVAEETDGTTVVEAGSRRRAPAAPMPDEQRYDRPAAARRLAATRARPPRPADRALAQTLLAQTLLAASGAANVRRRGQRRS